MKEITALREKISAIDDDMIALFARRMDAVREVAQYKKEHHLPVLNSAREREVLCHAVEQADETLEGYVKTLFSTLLDVSRSYQNKLIASDSPVADKIHKALEITEKQFPSKAVVACQGMEGAYSQQACDRFFSLPSIMYFRTFEGVFQAVEKGLCKYGILPIENSTAGSVNQVYDLMKHYKFHIARSMKLRVDHRLLARPDTKLENIKEIYSHDQAINQCSEFLKNHPNMVVTMCENTALAAKIVAESGRSDVAAISSQSCAGLYDLCVLSDTIQNNDNNYTRFICITKDLEIYPGADKTSLMISIAHKPGSLYSTIAKFAATGMNLTKLESRPIPGRDFEFMFYFDVEGSIYDPNVVGLITEMDRDFEQFTYLGSYSEIV